ncbi:MAG: pentapeptide repeat-containing protein [Phormidium sp.]
MKKYIKNWRITLIVLVWFTNVIIILYHFEWTGFGKTSNKSVSIEQAINPRNGEITNIKKETENFIPYKTLWDWLVLASTLAIPLVILRFQSVEKERDTLRADNARNETSETLREEAVRAYLDRIANLLVHQEYRTELFLNQDWNNSINNPIREIACANTLMVLRRLKNDPERQNQILYFLRRTTLCNFILVNSNLRDIKLPKTDLNNVCLAKADLSNADLTEAKLSEADLSEAILFRANLSKANLSKVKFISADLSAANLSGANFSSPKFSKADLSKAILNDSQLCNTNLSGVDLSDAKLNNADLSGADLSGAKLNNTNLSGAILKNANLTNADLSSADLKDTDFTGANLNGAVFTNADLLQAKLTGTKNIIPKQVKNAKNWYEAEYDLELRNQLNLPGKPID